MFVEPARVVSSQFVVLPQHGSDAKQLQKSAVSCRRETRIASGVFQTQQPGGNAPYDVSVSEHSRGLKLVEQLVQLAIELVVDFLLIIKC